MSASLIKRKVSSWRGNDVPLECDKWPDTPHHIFVVIILFVKYPVQYGEWTVRQGGPKLLCQD